MIRASSSLLENFVALALDNIRAPRYLDLQQILYTIAFEFDLVGVRIKDAHDILAPQYAR